MVAGQPKEGDREQYRDRGNRDADDRERNHERERGKDPRRTDGGRGESSLPDGPRHAPQYPPYPYPYPPYDYGYHMYPPPPGQGHPYPVQHGYPQRYGGQFSDRERKSGHPSEWEREEHHDKHDFHPWAEGDHRPKRRWAGGEKERGSEKPPRILTKPDERKDSQKAGDAKDEVFTDLGADRGRPSTAIKKVESLSSDTAESLLKHHVTFADDKKEVPHSPVDSLPSSPVAPKMRSQQKKIIMRKLGEESPPERQDPPPSGGVKPSKERPKDLKPIPPGEPRSGEVSPDSKTPDSAALGAKGRQMAWNVNDRGPITSPKTLYEPEGKKSAVKFLRYQHASRDGGPKDRNKEGGEKEDRGTAASPSTPTGDIKVLPKEASEKDSQKMEEEETPPEKKTQAPSPSGERGLGEGGGRGDDKGETRKEKSKRLDSGEKPSYERERQDPREKQHRKEDGAKERASQQKQEVVSQDHDHWEPQPKEKEPEKERVGRRKPMESVGRGRGARERILQETRQITRQQEPGRGRGRDRGDRQEGSLPRDRRKRDFQEEPSHPGRDRRDVDQWERGRTDRPSLRPRREENRKPPPPKEREGGRQGGGKSRGEGRKEGRSEQPPPPTTISKESKPANAQLLPSTGATKPTDVQPSATPVAAKPATTIEVHPRQSILGEPPGKTFAELYAGKSFEELHAETAGFQQTDFSRLPRKPVAVQQAEGVTARAQHLVSKPAPSEGRVPVVEEQGEPKPDRRKSREAKGDEREGRRHDNRPRDGGYPPQREGGQRLDRDRDRGDKGGRPPQRERDRSERGYKANVKLSRGEQFEREGRETGDRRPHPRDSRRSDHPDKGEGRPPPRGQQPPGRDKPPRKKGETLDEPTKATHPQGSRRPPQATAQPQKRRENEETNLPSLGYTNLEVIDSDWEEDVLQLEQELDEDEGKTPQSEKKSQERGQRSERSEQSYPRGAPRTGRGGGPQRRNQRERRERNDQQSHEFAPKDFRAPVGRGRTEDGGGRKDRRVGDPLARPGSYSNQRRQGGKDGGRGDSRQGNRQQTPSEGSGGLDSLVNNAPPAKEKTPQTAGDKRVSDFERYDLNSLKVAIVDDIGGGNVEPGRFSPLSQGGFVEVTSKKDKKEKLKKEKEEQRRAEEEHRRQQDEERQRKNKVAYSHPRQGSPPQLAWAATKPDSDLWGSDGSGGAQWLSPLLHSSSSAPGAPLSLPQQMWTLGAHSPGQYIGVIGDTLQNKPLLSTPGVHPVLQTSSMENTTYSLFGASSTVTPFAPTGLTPSGHMLNSAVSLTFPGSSEEPFPSEDPLGTATEPVATASPDEPPEEEGKEEDVADKDGGPEFKKVEKRMKPNKSSLPPRFQQGKQSGAGRGRGMGRGGDRRERERESKPVGGSRHEKVGSLCAYVPACTLTPSSLLLSILPLPPSPLCPSVPPLLPSFPSSPSVPPLLPSFPSLPLPPSLPCSLSIRH